ncbi:MAG: fumarylacetoacetate hydrolase family protein [Variovorax sp.]
MKICRFDDHRLGVVLEAEGEVADVSAVLDSLPAVRYPLPRHDPLIANLNLLRARIEEALPKAKRTALSSVKLLSPVANPGKIMAAPVNYLKHLQEVQKDPSLHHNNSIAHIQKAGIFLKATSSLIGAGEAICIAYPDRRTDPEIELVIVIGRKAKDVKAADALGFVAGYAIGLDVTIRGPEDRSLRKSPDTYTVLGPWLVTADELGDPGALSFALKVNDEAKPRQASNTNDLIIDVPALIEWASSFYTLHPGDLLFTGTPEGVSQIKAGDQLEAQIERIGRMRVAVRAAA